MLWRKVQVHQLVHSLGEAMQHSHGWRQCHRLRKVHWPACGKSRRPAGSCGALTTWARRATDHMHSHESNCVYEFTLSRVVSRWKGGRLLTGVRMNRYSIDCVKAIRSLRSGPVTVILGVAAPTPKIVPSRTRARGIRFWMEK